MATTLTTENQAGPPVRLRLTIRGAVQGVGFRPFVYRLAGDAGLPGWVNNSPQGVFVEVEGPRPRLEEFQARLRQEKPPLALIERLDAEWLAPVGYTGFEIRPSAEDGARRALILPDIATCAACLRELRDPGDRRYRYPFINCTNCGPRFSIIEALPYDRPNTTMRRFPLCSQCRAEYEDPRDRRFHAQPIACPVCGPHLELWGPRGTMLASHDAALRVAVCALRGGAILALKGLGGFHLVVDAHNEEAVQRLRTRKHRAEKPFALMFPDLAAIQAACEVAPLEEELLLSAAAPIVLLRRRPGGAEVAPGVAPDSPYLGAMLPYTPLHHLLLADFGGPVVATSGNRAEEPICTDEGEALARLGDIADLFLVHNRPIARAVDDSVVAALLDEALVIRRARGYAPLPVHCPDPLPPLLAVGGHLKNTVALAVGQDVFLSQHIGDLETALAEAAFRRVIADFARMYAIIPEAVACDLHPDYRSTQFARGLGLPVRPVQHHLAHVLGCLAENGVRGPALGVAWDGTGYGPDGTIWGGEFFAVTPQAAWRLAHWRPFSLPGGDAAVREPRRAAVGLLYEWLGEAAFAQADLPPLRSGRLADLGVLRAMLVCGLNTPRTSSVGRLFDAVAALLGLRQHAAFEGQAALALEWVLPPAPSTDHYPLGLLVPAPAGGGAAREPALQSGGLVETAVELVLDWAPLLAAILDDIRAGQPVSEIATRFHNTLVAYIVVVAEWAGQEVVALSGGCFQNRYLTTQAVGALRVAGFHPVWHRRIPPNDGGLALGQLIGALRSQEEPYVPGRPR